MSFGGAQLIAGVFTKDEDLCVGAMKTRDAVGRIA
jgi:hypothetical protein